ERAVCERTPEEGSGPGTIAGALQRRRRAAEQRAGSPFSQDLRIGHPEGLVLNEAPGRAPAILVLAQGRLRPQIEETARVEYIVSHRVPNHAMESVAARNTG